MSDRYCVYEHVFPNGKKYIGISCDAEKRWRNGKGYETQGKIANAIKHYGWENVKHNIIVDGVSKEQAQALERYLIAELNTIKRGYNTSIGGDNINGYYLNSHVLAMIRESKYMDKKYGTVQTKDGIVSFCELGKTEKRIADLINSIDEEIESDQILRSYKYDKGDMRVDHYFWNVHELVLIAFGKKKRSEFIRYGQALSDWFNGEG